MITFIEVSDQEIIASRQSDLARLVESSARTQGFYRSFAQSYMAAFCESIVRERAGYLAVQAGEPERIASRNAWRIPIDVPSPEGLLL